MSELYCCCIVMYVILVSENPKRELYNVVTSKMMFLQKLINCQSTQTRARAVLQVTMIDCCDPIVRIVRVVFRAPVLFSFCNKHHVR